MGNALIIGVDIWCGAFAHYLGYAHNIYYVKLHAKHQKGFYQMFDRPSQAKLTTRKSAIVCDATFTVMT